MSRRQWGHGFHAGLRARLAPNSRVVGWSWWNGWVWKERRAWPGYLRRPFRVDDALPDYVAIHVFGIVVFVDVAHD